MKDAKIAIDDMMVQLSAPPQDFCMQCGRRIVGLQGVLCDVDQAFEACSAETVARDWSTIALLR